ncbi:MAG TPA: hypothetical protein VGD62_06435 [Acidobacteriaceae bacterium]
MKRIGVLFGMEDSFPGALVERINAMGAHRKGEPIQAEAVCVGAVALDTVPRYAVIIDRISHDVPFYRAFLKHAVLNGTAVINNPFWWSADDKFFNYSLAAKLGVAVPRTVILPHKHFPELTTERSMRNLIFPLPWEDIFEKVGFPAFLKPVDGGGWRDVYHVHNADEFFRAYDQSRDLCMTLQAAVRFTDYFRCYVVGQREVRIMPYDPRRPHHERYLQDPPAYDPALLERVRKDALTLCTALGYDLNTVEFAVEDGIPYAIDFMNPAPDADYHSVGAASFEWIVDAVARLAIEKANASHVTELFHWGAFLGGGQETFALAASAAEKKPAKAAPKKAAKKTPAKAAPKKAAQETAPQN